MWHLSALLWDPQLHSDWPSYGGCSCCAVKRGDKQAAAQRGSPGKNGSRAKLATGKAEKSESFLSQRSFPWGGLGGKKQNKQKNRLKCFRCCALRMMQMLLWVFLCDNEVDLQVKRKDLGFILYTHPTYEWTMLLFITSATLEEN